MGRSPDITFQIHNEGRPIEKSALPTIFEIPRRRIEEDERRDDYGHLGIGLFVVKKIIEAHSGTISVSSTVADGTTFLANLPRVENAKSKNVS